MVLTGCAVSEAPAAEVRQQKLEVEDQRTGEVRAAASDRYEICSKEEENRRYVELSQVQGQFSFNQNVLTPADEMFNLFGTVLTGACAKPAFALENGEASYYVNVGGSIKKAYTVNLRELAPSREKEKTVLCSCATGAATANIRITGVPVEDIIQLAEPQEEINTITVVGSDGYGMPLPLSYVLEKEALVVYQVNGRDLPSGTQLWIPETVAKYFIRDVVDIELSYSDELPQVDMREDSLRAEVTIQNSAAECEFVLGDEVAFEGYADDCGDRIAAVEFSLDGGETWTRYETKGTTADRWVYWNFSFVPEEAGDYRLKVQAVTEKGRVSPLAAEVTFQVNEAGSDTL